MKILVVGAGAIGGYYGSRLISAGADVTFLVRPRRAAALAAAGLEIQSALGDFNGRVSMVLRGEIKTHYDVLLLACKAYDLQGAIDDFSAGVGPETVIVPFLNGLGSYDLLDARFGRERVAGGVSYIATTLHSDNVIRHDSAMDIVMVGDRAPGQRDTIQRFHNLLSQSKGIRTLSSSIDQALWNKWVMLASGALMTCLMRGTVADIVASRDGEQLMRSAINECLAVAEACGYPVPDAEAEQIRARLLDRNSHWAASMMRDISVDANQIEAEAIVGDLLSLAEKHGLTAGLIRTAYCHLQVYQRRHHNSAA
ncbi:2-dehydropantoate 2-reductase [Paraburkholderia sp. ZP32-5]|uniref:2-dehydropantoate 2-reductase n=1 Tax=Paraburkholderia sp. ZP32-5 TaxID=2883245 RepID=UPI001F1B88EB|nr:2-dehydropantoate 2-reductase [Paraburkholderia sp. ZP32-5]